MKILPPIKPYRVLDLGCGEGKDAVFLAKCGYADSLICLSRGLKRQKSLQNIIKLRSDFLKRIYLVTILTRNMTLYSAAEASPTCTVWTC